jgi:prepilin-type N-terminal cleavage/methylation domain-containing protein
MIVRHKGFTIVELLIVIVVIGILAAITMVAYNGIQTRAKDSQRKSDIALITKALEYYYEINRQYPAGSGSSVINNAWSTTADASWQNLRAQLVPAYIGSLPEDPVNTQGSDPRLAGSYGYAYYANTAAYCGAAARQMYILTYRLEGSAQSDTLLGDCTTNVLRYAAASNYRVTK